VGPGQQQQLTAQSCHHQRLVWVWVWVWDFHEQRNGVRSFASNLLFLLSFQLQVASSDLQVRMVWPA
jgi:hypothetical protein